MKYLITFLLCMPVFAKKVCMTNVKYKYTYDGDTIKVDVVNAPDVLGGDLLIRFLGIDTPEIKGGTAETKAMAEVAKRYVQKRIGDGKDLQLCYCKKDKYFRLDCIIRNKLTRNLNKELLDLNYGNLYYGNKKDKPLIDKLLGIAN